MTYNCFVIDDEPHAIRTLIGYIKKLPELILVGTSLNPVTAINEIVSQRVDITFLDVDMPELNGLEMADIIGSHTAIVFTTAFPNYAVHAFEKDASDFLLKPIPFNKFLKSVQKVTSAIMSSNLSKEVALDHFFINPGAKGKMIKVYFREIQYIEGLLNFVTICTDEGNHICYLTMKEIEAALPVNQFIRIHKSYIANSDKIRSIDGNQILLSKGVTLPLGASYKKSFFNRISNHIIRSKRG
jgi:DNA-binding LytR/AlgR family response regulator